MGRKVHPFGFRIGIVRDWQAKWYADKHYPDFLHEDLKIRKAIRSRYGEAGVSLVEIERQPHRITLTVHTSRPGIVIGRGGQRVDETRHYLEELVGQRVQLNIQEIRQPELDAYLVARVVAEQIGRRIAYRRAMKQALFRTMQAGAKGMRISCSGRLGGGEIARRQMMHQGQVPLHTLRADIDYGVTEAHTTLGRIGIKVWIYRGDVLPEVEEAPPEVEEAAAVAEPPAEEKVAEAKPAAEPTARKEEEVAEKKAAKPKAKKVAKVKPVAKKEEEVAEKKAAKPKAKKVVKAKPAVKKEETVAEKKAAKPKAKKEKEAVKPKAKKAAKPKAKKAAKAKPAVKKEEEAAKPKAKKVVKAKPAAKPKAKKEEKTKSAKKPSKAIARKKPKVAGE